MKPELKLQLKKKKKKTWSDLNKLILENERYEVLDSALNYSDIPPVKMTLWLTKMLWVNTCVL
jgi:hypothetical protein